ncbi:MAG: hypothetical protein N2691_04470 [Patescibacteria group bacterium]|nr:hypothetical protein [Patescibacteria group bacterium]
MKVYFTASIAGKDQYIENYCSISGYLRSKNIDVIADHILKGNEQTVNKESREQRLKFHKQLEHWIHTSDCMIAETSFPSISVGYEISLALKLGKPVLVMFSKGDPPSLLAYHNDEKLMCEKYSMDNISEVLDSFLHFVHEKSDMRFTFFITPRIASFLDGVARDDKLPKSVYLRKLIENDMKKRNKA